VKRRDESAPDRLGHGLGAHFTQRMVPDHHGKSFADRMPKEPKLK
jgi:hypothetical protein